MRETPAGQIVVANRLTDGRTVYLAQDGAWVASIAAGALATRAEAAGRLLATAQQAEAANIVVDPYLIDVRIARDGREPIAFRESIRAAGPTVRTDQAA